MKLSNTNMTLSI